MRLFEVGIWRSEASSHIRQPCVFGPSIFRFGRQFSTASHVSFATMGGIDHHRRRRRGSCRLALSARDASAPGVQWPGSSSRSRHETAPTDDNTKGSRAASLTESQSRVGDSPSGWRTARKLPFPPVDDPALPPLRPERHVSNSVATMRRKLTAALAERLSRCPAASHHLERPSWFDACDAVRLDRGTYFESLLAPAYKGLLQPHSP